MKFLYKLVNGEVEAKLFKDDENPKGWADSPEKAKKKPKKKGK